MEKEFIYDGDFLAICQPRCVNPMDLSSSYAAILCGGKSRRLGQDKALMYLNGSRIIDIIIQTLQPLFDPIFFISDVRDKIHGVDITSVADEIPNLGPLGGIYTALGVGIGEYCFVTACDTPFLTKEIIQALWNEVDGEDIIVPKYQGLAEPLVGFYARRCRERIGEALEIDQKQTRSLWNCCNVRFVDLDKRFPAEYLQRVFFNINTVADFDTAREMYGTQYA
jgi:molybdopterin-guanine dinucleotide biosynthesis protein A